MMEMTVKQIDGAAIERIVKRKFTRINVIVDGREIGLAYIGTNSLVNLDYKVVPGYVVAYSTKLENGNKKSRVEGVYDRANKKLIQVTNKNRKILEYMTISKKRFCLATVLEYLNYGKINAASVEECIEFESYLTVDSEIVERKEIENAILTAYPKLKEYTGYEEEMKLEDYKKIIEEFGTDELYFNIMPMYGINA